MMISLSVLTMTKMTTSTDGGKVFLGNRAKRINPIEGEGSLMTMITKMIITGLKTTVVLLTSQKKRDDTASTSPIFRRNLSRKIPTRDGSGRPPGRAGRRCCSHRSPAMLPPTVPHQRLRVLSTLSAVPLLVRILPNSIPTCSCLWLSRPILWWWQPMCR